MREGRNGGRLKDFEKGKSGNPNGRPKGVPNTATRLEKFLNAVMKGKDPITGEETSFTVAEMMDLKQVAKALKGDTTAWDKLNDRLEGRAKQSTEVSGKDGEPIQFEQTVIKIAYRPPADAKPTASKAPNPAKGERKKG